MLIFVLFDQYYYHTFMTKTVSYAKAREIFREHNGLLRTAQAIKLGIPPATLYAMRSAGVITQESRGLYRLAEAELASNPDLVYVCQRVPKAVVCLISALDFHDLTTQVPHWVTIALPRGARKPTLDFPPVRSVHMSESSYLAGIEIHESDGLPIRVYCAEKTIADCIKFRGTIGVDVMQEALRFYMQHRSFRVDLLLHYARINRVERLLQRYMEMLI